MVKGKLYLAGRDERGLAIWKFKDEEDEEIKLIEKDIEVLNKTKWRGQQSRKSKK